LTQNKRNTAIPTLPHDVFSSKPTKLIKLLYLATGRRYYWRYCMNLYMWILPLHWHI